MINTSSEWDIIQPQVNSEAEFFEIVNDFGDPLEVLREAISNAIDAHATSLKVNFDVETIEGRKKLVITFQDNGDGMTREILTRDFWGLGYSPSRQRNDAIGEKGHGTKIYLRSEKVIVKTQSKEGAYLSECDFPLGSLSTHTLHRPKIKTIENFLVKGTGTVIRIEGYNDNERSRFVQDIVKDYILWFTKIGSVEREFGIKDYKDFKISLKCLDSDDFENILFGHVFPKQNHDINKLFEEHELEAADLYVKRYVIENQRLKNHPEVTYQAVIYVEGDKAKRTYNPMIRERVRSDSPGKYRVSDRYGIWLAKDYIPVVRVNDWITGFGSGSNAFVLLHGFVNCQSLKLTANRGTIANTDPQILEELKSEVQQLVSNIDDELRNKGLYTLRTWQEEDVTLKQEKAEFERRVKSLKGKKVAKFENLKLVEPSNESELFGLFVTVYSLRPDLFDFELLDYNTTKGVDNIARHRSANRITEGEHGYIELKYKLQPKINHAYQYLRWLVCWDFDKNVIEGTELRGIEDNDIRRLETDLDDDGDPIYFLNNKRLAHKVQVIRLKQFVSRKMGLDFEVEI